MVIYNGEIFISICIRPGQEKTRHWISV